MLRRRALVRLPLAALAAFPCALHPAGARKIVTGLPKLEAEAGAHEGPSWNPFDGFLYYVGGDRISRVGLHSKAHVFRDKAGGPHGSTVDPEGRLLVCEGVARRVTRIGKDGSVTVLAGNYEGKKLNSPNDLSLDSKGRIYFTDPRYGRRDGMEILDESGQPVEGVYRIDAPGKVARIIAREVERPNGVLVSPGDRYLYVADNCNNRVGGARKLLRFDLRRDGTIDPDSRKVIFDWRTGRGPDGVKMDRQGRLYVAAGSNRGSRWEDPGEYKGGIYILSDAGELLEFVHFEKDETTNCAFGGPDLKTLFVTAGGQLWSVRVSTPGRISARR